MKRLMQTDQSLAVKATKFVEYGRDQVVTEILNAVPTGLTSGWNLYKLPVSTSHEARLREILKHRNTMGGVAAGLLLNINGVAIKNELIEEMFLNPSDFNFCTELGRALRPFADSNDLVQIINRFRDLTFHEGIS
jgi:hypothetical protein